MRVLLIDDSPFDRELIQQKLENVWPEIEWVEVINQRAFSDVLQKTDFDFVLTDYQLKWTTGLEVLRDVRACYPDIPVIMVTDTGSEEIAVQGMKLGLSDYVLKTHLNRLPFAIQEALDKRQLLRQQVILEKQVQQAQKMESLGLLVSGMAHDFNNLLAGIMGYAQRGLKQASQEQNSADYFQHIYTRAEQGARMTRQLLTFARGNQLEPTAVAVNTLIAQTLEFVGSLIGPDIKLEFIPDSAVQTLYADATQIEQTLMNLCVNARDAMPQGGLLQVTTHLITIEEEIRNRLFDAQPGTYVQIIVADTGKGMPPEVQARLFEPFFTTKEVGRGTGLGLAVVYGIIQQHRGLIEVESIPGQGTRFILYFPVLEHEQSLTPPINEISPPESIATVLAPLVSRTEEPATILMVEDDPDVQVVIQEILCEEGYRVLVANDGEEGLELFLAYAPSIQLVIADVMMPKMRGKAFQEMVRQHNPQMKVLVMSGYQQSQLQQKDLLDPHSSFLQKPFDLETLTARVRELLSSAV